MKLKSNVERKINNMEKNELLNLINTLCLNNEDVVMFLNNYYTNIKLDYEKINEKIDKLFFKNIVEYDKAINIYCSYKKRSNDCKGLALIGLNLLKNLIDYFEYDYSSKNYKKIMDISEYVCEYIAQVDDNYTLREMYESLVCQDELYEDMMDIYYSYFDE